MPFFMNLAQLHHCFKNSSGVVSDSRDLKPDCFFIALRGEKYDGNQFAEKALENGAKYALVDRPEIAEKNHQFILVKNTLETLQELAKFHRKTLKAKIIALTGSNGKTTTKELIKSVLSQQFITQATTGNLNNHIGVPLTLLNFEENTEIGIVEMGANHKKEIDFLCQIAQPEYGLITNFGQAHLEGFGGIEGVIQGKSELYKYLAAAQGTLFINIDDPLQEKWITHHPHFSFGTKSTADCYLEYITEKEGVQAVEIDGKNVKSQLYGDYNSTNIAAAIALGKYFKLKHEQIANGVFSYQPKNNRSEIIQKGHYKITMDAYNANPSSMQASISAFIKSKKKSSTAILGDMFELGKYSALAHQQITDLLVLSDIDQILLVGNHFIKTQFKDPRVKAFSTLEGLLNYLIENPLKAGEILIKGSRGMTLEKVLAQL